MLLLSEVFIGGRADEEDGVSGPLLDAGQVEEGEASGAAPHLDADGRGHISAGARGARSNGAASERPQDHLSIIHVYSTYTDKCKRKKCCCVSLT